MAKNFAAVLKKYKDRAGASTTEMQQGVEAVTVNPAQKAADAANKWIANLQAAFSNGTFQAGLAGVTLQDWKNSMINKGIANYRTGIQNLSPRAVKNMEDVQRHAETVRQEVAQMPNNTEADADARMMYAVRRMREFKANR